MLCVLNLYKSGGAYSLKSTPNDRFFEKIFHDNFYLLSEFLPEIFRRTNMVVYTLEQRWEVGLRSTYRRWRFSQKKIIFLDEAHFDIGGYVNKQNCCVWGTENPHA